MTIPEDVRDIIRTTLEYYVEYWDENDTSMDNRYSTDAHADAEIVYAWLDAQPEAPERWEPVEVGEKYDVAGIIGRRVLYRMDEDTLNILTVTHNTVESSEMLQLPDNLRLCRRVVVIA